VGVFGGVGGWLPPSCGVLAQLARVVRPLASWKSGEKKAFEDAKSSISESLRKGLLKRPWKELRCRSQNLEGSKTCKKSNRENERALRGTK